MYMKGKLSQAETTSPGLYQYNFSSGIPAEEFAHLPLS